jgi:hypothetical protein
VRDWQANPGGRPAALPQFYVNGEDLDSEIICPDQIEREFLEAGKE